MAKPLRCARSLRRPPAARGRRLSRGWCAGVAVMGPWSAPLVEDCWIHSSEEGGVLVHQARQRGASRQRIAPAHPAASIGWGIRAFTGHRQRIHQCPSAPIVRGAVRRAGPTRSAAGGGARTEVAPSTGARSSATRRPASRSRRAPTRPSRAASSRGTGWPGSWSASTAVAASRPAPSPGTPSPPSRSAPCRIAGDCFGCPVMFLMRCVFYPA